MVKPMVYLAIAFTHDKDAVMKMRYELANWASSILMDEGYVVFSPISHSYGIAKYLGKMVDHDYWMDQCLPWMESCDLLVVFDDGPAGAWQHSKGVQAEIHYAKELGISVEIRRF